MWGSPRTNPNGRLVETWAAAEDLRILNQDSGNTFVGHRGGFIVDLTWASPAALRKVSEWHVLDHVKTGSDHLYVWFRVILTRDGTIPPPTTAPPKRLRWALKKLDEDKLLACIHTACWPDEGRIGDITDPNAEADHLMFGVVDACAASMSLVPEGSVKRTYWWAPRIAALRSECAYQGRRLRRATRRLGPDHPDTRNKHLNYGVMRTRLDAERRGAKRRAWEEFIASLDENSWGRPYKTVFRKLKKSGAPVTP
ncbi:uncharacterized protein [Anoplolepis gracilipes]|uniref:uncharacterized protein n=1 Tax=Anoplolepis gracilipes TaxID=354296 RepID=UPI003B9F2E60